MKKNKQSIQNSTRHSYIKFNEILEQFFQQMKSRFPNSKEIEDYYNYFLMSKGLTNWVDLFMDAVGDHETEILNKDPQGLENMELAKQLNLVYYYNECSETDRDIIWQYLQTLYLLGHSYKNYNSNFMKMVESIANESVQRS